MTGGTFTGIFLVLVLIIGIGVYSGKKVQNSGDFLTGSGKAGSWLVCGSIMGSLVSSQATIGTGQLAFLTDLPLGGSLLVLASAVCSSL